MTEWRAIPGYEGFFEASDTGSVRSIDRVVVGKSGRLAGVATVRRGMVLSQSLRLGYPCVAINKEGVKRRLQVHRLVLLAFVGPCPDGMVCCHNDGNKQNNHVSNLRWDTQASNIQDTVRHGTHAHARKTHCPHGHPYDEGSRVCSECRRGWLKKNYWAKRAKNPPNHCRNGHEFTPENTYYPPQGATKRLCRECMRARARRYYNRAPIVIAGLSLDGVKAIEGEK